MKRDDTRLNWFEAEKTVRQNLFGAKVRKKLNERNKEKNQRKRKGRKEKEKKKKKNSLFEYSLENVAGGANFG